METKYLPTLKIHQLTQAQYDREKNAGNLDPDALYLTPDKPSAPAGYGAFGEPCVYIGQQSTLNDLYAKLDEILQTMPARSMCGISVMGVPTVDVTGLWHGILTKSTENLSTLHLWTYAAADVANVFDVQFTRYNNWDAPEWVNPPMKLGVEYRTTERWMGKAVYTALINMGIVNDSKNVKTGLTGFLIRKNIISGGRVLPLTVDGINDLIWDSTGVDSITLYVKEGGGWAGNQAYVQIWYTKD